MAKQPTAGLQKIREERKLREEEKQRELLGEGLGGTVLKKEEPVIEATPTISNTSTSSVDTRTEEQKRQEEIGRIFEETGGRGAGEDLFPGTEESLQEFFERQRIERERFEQESSELEKEIRRQQQIARQQERATQGALRAGFAEGREGATTTAAPLGREKISSIISSRLQSAEAGFDSALRRQRQLEEDLKEAQKQGRRAAAADLSIQLGEAAEAVQKAKRAAEEARIQARDETLGVLDQINSFTESLGTEGFANIGVSSLMNLVNSQATSAGLNAEDTTRVLQSVLARQSIAKQIQESKTPQEKEGLLEMFNRLGISPTKGVQQTGAIQALQNQLAAGQITQDEFDKFSNIVQEIKPEDQITTEKILEERGETTLNPTIPLDGFEENAQIQRTGNNVAVDTNNPGNITADSIPAGYTKEEYGRAIGATGTYKSPNGREYFLFPSVDNGVKALENDLRAKATGRSRNISPNDTLSRFVRVYTKGPNFIGPLDAAEQNYINTVVEATGANRGTPIRNIDIAKLAKGVMKAEGFSGFEEKMKLTDVESWGYEILDGSAKISNVPDEIRNDVIKFTRQKREEGYKTSLPNLTETQLNLVNQISDDFNSNRRVGDMLDVKSGFDTVSTLFSSEDKIRNATGFDDVAAINAFQRMIDPGATVREGDVELLQTSIPFLTRVSPTFKWSQFKNGDKLPQDVRESLLRVATDVYNNKARDFNTTTGSRFKSRADAAQVPFNLIGEEFTIYDQPLPPTPEQKVTSSINDEISALDAEIAEIENQLNQ